MAIKILLYPLAFLIYFILCIVPIRAYEFPDDACIVNVDDSNLGNIDIYIPCNLTSNLSFDNHEIVNVTSTNVTGYVDYYGDEYTITFQPFQFGRYRINGSSNYQYLDTDYVELINFEERSNFDNLSNAQISLITIFISGGLLWLIFLKR